jgi:hypothetical protein
MSKINPTTPNNIIQIIDVDPNPVTPQLKMENAEPPSIHMQANHSIHSQTPEPTQELARPVKSKDKEYTAIQDDDGQWYLVTTNGQDLNHLTELEAKQAAQFLNEQGSNVITLFCRNEKCKDKGSWIKRASGDVKKNVYFCSTCNGHMIR